MDLSVFKDHLVVPYIRQADFAARLPWSYGERRLLDYLLVYVEEGHCRFIVNKTPYDLYGGDLCLVQPGDLIFLEGLTRTITPFAHLDFFYNPLREQSFPTSSGMTNLSSFMHLMQPRLNNMEGVRVPAKFRPSQPLLFKNKFYRMIGKWKEGVWLNHLEVQHLGIELLLELLRDFSEEKRENRDEQLSGLKRLFSLLSLRLHEKITIKDMAGELHLSPSRFSIVFKDRYGESPHHFLMKLRVERAMELLKSETDYSVTQISEYCGFNTIQHFTNTFRQFTGINPSQYRRSKL